MKALDGKKETANSKDTLNAIGAGGNIGPLKQNIKKGVNELEKLADERSSINAKMNAVRTDLEAQGIPKKVLNWAMQYMNMDPDKRDGCDVAYSIVREAIELPVDQGEMFEKEETGEAK